MVTVQIALCCICTPVLGLDRFACLNASFWPFSDYCENKFSFDFHMKVAREVVKQVIKGAPKPEDLINPERPCLEAKATPTKGNLTSEDSPSSCTRLWAEVMRNLGKDVYKHSSILLTGSSLSVFSQVSGSKSGDVLAFSCGHTFTEADFKVRVLIEFKERVQGFPLPIPQTLLQLLNCYTKLRCCPLACPYCVFHYLRQLQLQEHPDTPIKPWT